MKMMVFEGQYNFHNLMDRSDNPTKSVVPSPRPQTIHKKLTHLYVGHRIGVDKRKPLEEGYQAQTKSD